MRGVGSAAKIGGPIGWQCDQINNRIDRVKADMMLDFRPVSSTTDSIVTAVRPLLSRQVIVGQSYSHTLLQDYLSQGVYYWYNILVLVHTIREAQARQTRVHNTAVAGAEYTI